MTAGNTQGRAWSQWRAAVRGRVNVRALTGRFSVRSVVGSLNVRAVSGSLNVRAVRGRFNVRAVTLACLSLGFAAQSVKLFELMRLMLSPSLEQVSAVQIPRSAERTAKIDLSAIASAHLFGRYDAATRQEPAADGREDLILSGILFYSGKNSLSRIMLMEYPKTSFAVGDRVTGDLVVGAISPRYAILSDGGRERILRLSWSTRKQGATGAATDNGNDDLGASNDDPSQPPPILEAYVDPVGDG